jgi:hypothetical protein
MNKAARGLFVGIVVGGSIALSFLLLPPKIIGVLLLIAFCGALGAIIANEY